MATSVDVPEVPHRHPARFYRIETTDLAPPSPPPQPLSEELIDLWEHATLLFYGFELRTSAESFLYLSSIIDLRFESAQCLLNAAIVFARLGDYDVAIEALDGAVKADEFRSLALYLSGHVEFELGDLSRSEVCFHAALTALGDQPQHFAALGFTLDRPKILHALHAFDIENVSLDSIPDLGSVALPANSVFDSPQRSPDSGYASPQSPTKSIDQSQFENSEASVVKQTPKALLARSKQEPDQVSHQPNLRSLEYSKGDVQWHGPEEPAMTLTPKRSMSLTGLVRQFSGRRKQAEEAKSKSHPTFPRSGFLARLVPREARVQNESTRDLAEIIKGLPDNDVQSDDADSKVEEQSTSEPADPELIVEASSDGDREMKSVGSQDFATEAAVSEDVKMSDDLHPPPRRFPTNHPMISRDSLGRVSTLNVSGHSLAPSVRSVYTEATSALADDEASDSGNETDCHPIRSSTPTPPHLRASTVRRVSSPWASKSSLSTLDQTSRDDFVDAVSEADDLRPEVPERSLSRRNPAVLGAY